MARRPTVYADGSYERFGISDQRQGGTNGFTAQAQDAHGHHVSQTVTAWFNPNSGTLKYDLNGNLTNDTYRSFFYDVENQLTNVTITGVAKSEFAYDGLRRRRIRKEYRWNGSWVKTNEVHYVYYGGLVMQERDSNNVSLVKLTREEKTWGAACKKPGEVGGLLARTDGSESVYYHADEKGNVSCLTDTGGAVVARYEYDPYGNMLAMSGPMADSNLYRFSSKEWSVTAGLYSFGYRFYNPTSQRWLNRDPIGEMGGFNLFTFVGNGPFLARSIFSGLALYPPGFVGPLPPGSEITPQPPASILGGPWRYINDPQNPLGGKFFGPKGPGGQRSYCVYTPKGSVNNNKDPYWKSGTTGTGGPEQHYDKDGKPITADQAHPSPNQQDPNLQPFIGFNEDGKMVLITPGVQNLSTYPTTTTAPAPAPEPEPIELPEFVIP